MLKLTYKGLTIEVITEQYPENPRESMEHLGKMVCWHKRHRLGDNHKFGTPEEFRAFLTKTKAKIVVFPLYLFDHSGLILATHPFSCHWDSGRLGWIYATYNDIRRYFGSGKVDEEILAKAKADLTGEVEEYNSYLSGDVYEFHVSDKDEDEIESCCGYIGREDAAIADAKSAARSFMKYQVKNLRGVRSFTHA